jgi:ribosomal protein S27AE
MDACAVDYFPFPGTSDLRRAVKRVCANCGFDGIEAGEAGARSHCARCGHMRFVEDANSANSREFAKFPSPPLARAKQLFQAMHEAIDKA